MAEEPEEQIEVSDPAEEARNAILAWAKAQPVWKQHALRLALLGTDRAKAADVIHALVVAEVSGVESDPIATPIEDHEVGGPKVGVGTVTLKALGQVTNVNRLAKDQELSFGTSGLTCVYGDNGAGKSGYARIFKHACGARQQEDILPDVFAGAAEGPASAQFIIEVAGSEEVVPWSFGEAPDSRLAMIAVFDSQCAPFYVEKSAPLNFVPYRLGCFQRLAALLDEVAARLDARIGELDAEIGVPISSEVDPEELAKQLAELGAVPDEQVDDWLAWSEADESSHQSAQASSISPAERQKALVAAANEIDTLVDTLRAAAMLVDDEHVKTYRQDLKSRDSLASAASMAAEEQFANEPLAGVGRDEWVHLYNSARAYSEHLAYPDREFPAHEADDRCVLCQQILGDEAQSRFVKFEEFVSGDLSSKAASAQERVDKITEELGDSAKKLGNTTISELLARLCTEEAMALEKARQSTLARTGAVQSILSNLNNDVEPAPVLDFAHLLNRSMNLTHEANDLSKTVASGNLDALVARARAIAARRALCLAKDVSKARVKLTKQRASLNDARALCNTSGVSRTGGDLIRTDVPPSGPSIIMRAQRVDSRSASPAGAAVRRS